MNKIAIIVSKGYEDIELITTIDFLKRVKINFDLISPENKSSVNGAHNAIVKTIKIENFKFNKYRSIFIPGGPAVNNLLTNKTLLKIIKQFWLNNKNIYAICAAPLILKKLGILQTIKHTAYPGCEYKPTFVNLNVVQDKNIITGSGPGSTNEFAFKIIENEKSITTVKNLKKELKID